MPSHATLVIIEYVGYGIKQTIYKGPVQYKDTFWMDCEKLNRSLA